MNNLKVAIIGTGPAAMMAATTLVKGGAMPMLYEKNKAAGRKILIAGSTGLNISNTEKAEAFAERFHSPSKHLRALLKSALEAFTVRDWLDFIEQELGIQTFEGTSGRYFLKEEKGHQAVAKAAVFLSSWTALLEKQGARFHYGSECVDFECAATASSKPAHVTLTFADGEKRDFSAVCFALGGGSYEAEPVRFPAMFAARGVEFAPFRASNVGYEIDWPAPFLKECEGKPFKNIVLSTSRGEKRGELVVTRYGIEGTPVYFVGETGVARLDLAPDLSVSAIHAKCDASRENYSPLRRLQTQLKLSPVAQALLFHNTPPEILSDLAALISRLKSFPLELKSPRPLEEAISASGGLSGDALDARFMLRKYPGAFAAGEMLDWDAPTGGYLIQGSVSTGAAAARGMLDYLRGLYQSVES